MGRLTDHDTTYGPLTFGKTDSKMLGLTYSTGSWTDDDDEGGWSSLIYDLDDTGEETEFSFEEHIMPHVEEGEVLVLMEAGAEKLRYIIGAAVAMQRKGEDVSVCQVYLDAIYEIAAKKFDVPQESITTATY